MRFFCSIAMLALQAAFVSVYAAAPVVHLGDPQPAFVETPGFLPQQVFLATATASVTDIDSTDFNGGNLTVSRTAAVGMTDFDVLDVASLSTASPNIRIPVVNMTTVRNVEFFNGTSFVLLGTIPATGAGSGRAGNNLTVTFHASNENATPASVTQLLKALTFRSNSPDPGFSRTFEVSVNDGSGNATSSASQAVNVTIVSVNTPPRSIAAHLPLSQIGATYTLTGRNAGLGMQPVRLLTVDDESGPAALTYTVTVLPQNGTLLLNGTNLMTGGQFTQAQVDDGLLKYIHNATGSITDKFIFSVSDGIDTLTGLNFTIDGRINPVHLASIEIGKPNQSGGVAEIVAFDKGSKRVYAIESSSVRVVDITDPKMPVMINAAQIDFDPEFVPNSIAIHEGIVAVALAKLDLTQFGNTNLRGEVRFYRAADGTFLNTISVGYLPDMVTFSPNGRYVLTANEAEPNAEYSYDPEGSIGIVDLGAGSGTIQSKVMALTQANYFEANFAGLNNVAINDGGVTSGGTYVGSINFNAKKQELRASGVRIFGASTGINPRTGVNNNAGNATNSNDGEIGGASVAQDLEPEYIAVSSDSSTAWIVCQENNAIVTLDLNSKQILSIKPLGYIDHLKPGSGIDAAELDDRNYISNLPVNGLFMPDMMKTITIGSTTYLLTANEGDAREWGTFSDINRASSRRLVQVLQGYFLTNQAGRLNVVSRVGGLGVGISGDNTGSNVYNRMFSLGSRSFSIFDPNQLSSTLTDGRNAGLVFDSGESMEQITAASIPQHFNASNNNIMRDNRSDDKGPEPEAITAGIIAGKTLAFVGLERIGGIVVYDISTPNAPKFVEYINTRDFSAPFKGDVAPEGIEFISAADSPSGSPLVIVGNEVSGTISIYTIEPANTAPSIQAPVAAFAVEDMVTAIPGISVIDAEATEEPILVSLAVNLGSLQLDTTKLNIVSGKNGTNGITVTGKKTDLNAALAGLQYVSSQDYNGPASLTIDVNDQAANALGSPLNAATKTVAIAITPLNDAPSPVDDAFTVKEDSTINILPVIANDQDVDSSLLTVTAATQPANGTVQIIGNAINYVPAPNFNGTDTFTYTISDGQLPGIMNPILPVDTLLTVNNGKDAIPVKNSGLGSAMAPVPGKDNEFYLLTDRGPNIDGSAPNTKVFPKPDFAPRIVKVRVNPDRSMELLESKNIKNEQGDDVNGLTNPVNTTGEIALDINGNVLASSVDGFDPEGLVALPDGTFWFCDEYGPFVVHLDADCKIVERLHPFAANGNGRKIPKVLGKRRANRGMEGLTITPDGKVLVGMMQSALTGNANPGAVPFNTVRNNTPICRILTYELATGKCAEYIYMLDRPSSIFAAGANSEIVAVSNTEFLVLERDGAFPSSPSSSSIKKIFRIDIAGATNVADPTDGEFGILKNGTNQTIEQVCDNKTAAAAIVELANFISPATPNGIVPVSKAMEIDLLDFGSQYNHDKPEGLAIVNGSRLAICNDDDFGIEISGDPSHTINIRSKKQPATDTIDFPQLLFVDLAAKVTVTVTPENDPPAIISQAVAMPTSAGVGQAVTFMVVAEDIDGDVLTYIWTFGDGTIGTGATLVKVYTSPGTYKASVTVTDGAGGSVNSDELTITVLGPSIGQGTDKDGDGISDEIENAVGSNPDQADTIDEVEFENVQIMRNLRLSGKDRASFQGKMPSDGNYNGKKVVVAIDRFLQVFELTANGKSKTPGFMLGKPDKKDGTATFKVNLVNIDLSVLNGSGISNTTTPKVGAPSIVKLVVAYDGKYYRQTKTLIYKAKQGRLGRAR